MSRNLAGQSPEAVKAEEDQDFRKLHREIEKLGLFQPRFAPYVRAGAEVIALILLGGYLLAFHESIFAHLLSAVLFATATAQLAFLCHDLGHNQVFFSRKANAAAGLVLSNLGIGVSFKTWIKKHSAHHSHTNEMGSDPDLEIPVIAFTAEQAQAAKPWLKPFIRFQDILFFPMLTLALQSLRWNGFAFLLSKGGWWRSSEIALMSLHLVTFPLVAVYLAGWLHGLGFFLVHQALCGVYLGLSFATNHKGMPILTEGRTHGFLYRQLVTTRNLTANRFVEWLFGGLGSQIEHHLFPMMPRHNLLKARKIVGAFCKQRGLPYHETGLWRGFGEVLTHLREVASVLRRA